MTFRSPESSPPRGVAPGIRAALAWALLPIVMHLGTGGARLHASESSQLEEVRSTIRSLEAELETLESRSADTREQQERLETELRLAEARVHELELILTSSRDEAAELRDQAAALADELDSRRELLRWHLEMMALMGQPGPLQLLYDAVRGGELDQAIGTISVLTAGQLRLLEEYRGLREERSSRLAGLSRVLEGAQREARQLLARRRELETVRERVGEELGRLERRERTARNRLADLKEREQALERLLAVVTARTRLTGNEDIRRYRGALPWPAESRIVMTFGRHYLPKYATYTVCNGLRLSLESGAEVGAVFPGVVAYARHFKGYGNMVVIDHGHDVYSLAAGLATIHVRLDQRVEMGTTLGLAPPPDEDGNLYLEIRVGDTPQDPRRWLQLTKGQS